MIYFQKRAGSRFYGSKTEEEMRNFLCNEESVPNLDGVAEPQARRLISNLLCEFPHQRWTAHKVYGSALFKSADDTVQVYTRLLEILLSFCFVISTDPCYRLTTI